METERNIQPVKLRPHHGMCLQFFQGKGYSGEFTAHMAEILRLLENHRDCRIEIADGADEICSACPCLHDGSCTSAEKTDRYDREVLTAAGLNSGTVTEGALFLQTVREKIILAGKRETICGDCQWTSLCTLEQMI